MSKRTLPFLTRVLEAPNGRKSGAYDPLGRFAADLQSPASSTSEIVGLPTTRFIHVAPGATPELERPRPQASQMAPVTIATLPVAR